MVQTLICCMETEQGGRTVKKRIAWLDFARSLAIFSVVVVHSLEMVYKLEFNDMMKIGEVSLIFRDIVFTFGRTGVPIFLALTGFLLLDRDFSTSDKILKFYKKNLLPLWLTTVIWIVIYFIAGVLKGTMEADFVGLLKDVLFLRTYLMGHMWYMPMIIGMYVALPFVSNAIKNISSKVLAIPYCIVLFLYFVFSLISVLENSFGFDLELERKLDTTFLGGTYGVYIIFGLFCKRGDLKKIKTPVVWAISALGFVFTVFMIWLSNSHGYDFHLWYDFPGIFLASMFAFEGFSRMKLESKAAKLATPLVTQISVVSLGMYFIHKPIINDISSFIVGLGFGRGISLVILVAAAFVSSFVIAFIISKIPVVKKLLLFIK